MPPHPPPTVLARHVVGLACLEACSAPATWARAGPQFFDIFAACAYLATALQPWIAGILLVTLVSYIPLTITLTEWRGRFRRCAPACPARSAHPVLATASWTLYLCVACLLLLALF